MKYFYTFVLLAVALFSNSPAYAGDVILYEDSAEICPVTVTADKEWKNLRIRRAPTCRMNREKTMDILHLAFSAIIENNDETKYKSVSLGRIEYYQWISRYLVEQTLADRRWSTETGTAVGNNVPNAFVESILSQPNILDPLNTAIAMTGQYFTGMSCEKVLVSGPGTKQYEPDWTPEGRRVPYDAICSLQINSID